MILLTEIYLLIASFTLLVCSASDLIIMAQIVKINASVHLIPSAYEAYWDDPG